MHTIGSVDDLTPGNAPSDPPPDPAYGPYPRHVAYVRPWSTETGRSTPAPVSPPTPAPKDRSHISTGIVALISSVVGAIAVVGILALLGLFSDDAADSAATGRSAPTTTAAREIPARITSSPADLGIAEAVAVKVVPSVVTVVVGELSGGALTQVGSGSGVILEDGYIITNHHVIAGETASRVILQDGRAYDATILGSDAYTDLAVLHVDIDGLAPIEFGSTAGLAIGRTAVAVGNPLGQAGGASLTVGVISALSRTVDFGNGDRLYGMLQTDAPITSGSSGGALVDENGSLVGITSAIGLSEAGAEGIGYAIPVELVQRITGEIIDTGSVKHPFFGIYGFDSITVADDGAFTPAGAEISGLSDGRSAAGDAGFLAGDIIVDVEGVEIRTMEDFVVELRLFHVGDSIEVTVHRDGEPITATVVLDERPEDPLPLIDDREAPLDK